MHGERPSADIMDTLLARGRGVPTAWSMAACRASGDGRRVMAVPRTWSLSQQSRDQAASGSSTVTAIVSSSVVPNAATRARRRAAIRSGAHAVTFANVRVRTRPPSRQDSRHSMAGRAWRFEPVALYRHTIITPFSSMVTADLSLDMPTRVITHSDNPWFFQSLPVQSSGRIRQKEPLRHVCIILDKCRNVNEVTDDNTSEKILH